MTGPTTRADSAEAIAALGANSVALDGLDGVAVGEAVTNEAHRRPGTILRSPGGGVFSAIAVEVADGRT